MLLSLFKGLLSGGPLTESGTGPQISTCRAPPPPQTLLEPSLIPRTLESVFTYQFIASCSVSNQAPFKPSFYLLIHTGPRLASIAHLQLLLDSRLNHLFHTFPPLPKAPPSFPKPPSPGALTFFPELLGQVPSLPLPRFGSFSSPQVFLL